MCWHRGTINTPGRTRYLLQQQYGQGWMHERFATFGNDIEEKVWVGASPQLRQVLGGAYVKARVKARVKAKTQAARASNANENLRRLEIDLM